VRQIINVVVYTTALCTASASGALAQHAPAPSVFNWTGFYAGINGGFGSGVARPAYDLSAPPDAAVNYAGFASIDVQTHRFGGFVAGGQAGYNYQFRNNVVLGIESDFQWSDIRATDRRDAALTINPNTPFPLNSLTSTDMMIRQNWFGTTRLRLGYQFADGFLAYATGGIAYSEFVAGNRGLGTAFTSPPVDFSHTSGAMTSTRVGWTAGAGLEHALGNGFSVKSEYLYSEYAGFSAPYSKALQSAPLITAGAFSTGPLGLHLVRAGLNYRFGNSGVTPDLGRSNLNNLASSPSRDWTGFYAGVNAGYGGGIVNPMLSETSVYQLLAAPGNTTATNITETMRSGGFLVGGQFGYNRQLAGRVVGGIETDLQWSGIRASNQSNISGLYGPPVSAAISSTSHLAVSQNWFGTTRLRLGYQAFDRFLVYATGGVAYAGFSAANFAALNDPLSGITATSGSGSSNKIGWTAGAGAEYAIAGNVSFKTEYLYSQYGGFGVPYQSIFAGGGNTGTTQGTLSTGTLGIHLVRAGLNWKLGESGR
jgi:outer membrane immunogenic protein